MFNRGMTAPAASIDAAFSGPLGFFGVAEISQPASANQAAPAAQSQQTLTDSTGGTSGTTLAAISNSLSGGVGVSSPTASAVNAQLAIIRDAVASLAAQLALIKADIAAMKTLQNQTRTDLVALGLQKGSA